MGIPKREGGGSKSTRTWRHVNNILDAVVLDEHLVGLRSFALSPKFNT